MIARGSITAAIRLVLLATLVAAGVFTFWPGIDLGFSGLFWGGDGFTANTNATLQLLRETVWTIAILICLLAALMLVVMALRRPATQRIATRIWGFIVLTYVLAPGVMANLLLKSHWGRARPRSVAEFGGTLEFTPPLEFSDQCSKNCSFVSGEASGVVATALIVTLAMAPTLGTRGKLTLLVPVWGVAIFTAMLRIAMGGHFLSDVVFGGLLTALIALILFLLLRLDAASPALTPRNLIADIRDAIAPKP